MSTDQKINEESSSYQVAYRDIEFLERPALRPVRLQLELLKPEMAMEEHKIKSTIVVFGSARLTSQEEAAQQLDAVQKQAHTHPQDERLKRQLEQAQHLLRNARYYEEARKLGRLVSSTCQADNQCDFVVVTGGGPGIMEAANRGAHDVNAKSIGLNITLPFEQKPNSYVTPELCFQFHYFALRKMHFLLRAKALVVFPGGFGTLDELFDALTLIQTSKMESIPVLLFGREYWQRVVNFEFLAEQGTISPQDIELISYVETAEEAWQEIARFYGLEL